MHPTVFKDCLDAIKKFLPDDKMAQVPLAFSREEGHGFRVPREWESGSCYVIIDVESATDVEVANFNEIAVQAALVNAMCVARPPHLGGTMALGVGGRLNVTLMGGLSSLATDSDA